MKDISEFNGFFPFSANFLKMFDDLPEARRTESVLLAAGLEKLLSTNMGPDSEVGFTIPDDGAQGPVTVGTDGTSLSVDLDGIPALEADFSGAGLGIRLGTVSIQLSGLAAPVDTRVALTLVSDLVSAIAAAPGDRALSLSFADRLAEAGLSEAVVTTDTTSAPVVAAAANLPQILGDGANNLLNGTAAGDDIQGLGGNDTINAGGGDDEVDGGGGFDTLNGGAGNDTMSGSFADDLLSGGSGNDVLRGDAGNDTLYGGSGQDTVDGGENSDVFGVDAEDTVTDTGTTGYDKAQVTSTTGITLDLAGWSGVERVNGNIGDDAIDGSSQTSALLLVGDKGDDSLTGGTGNDALIGNEGADTLIGGAGDDILLGNQGSDVFDGGSGNDIFFIGESGDVVRDGGAGNDRALIYDANGLDIAVGTWVGVERIIGYFGDDAIDATGLDASITLVGASGNDRLTGGIQSDVIYAGSGDDTLIGGTGNDALIGSDGDDVLIGGAGNDFYLGGNGADAYRFDAGFGNDVVAGFADGIDKLDFSRNADINSMSDLLIFQSGQHTFIRLAGGGAEKITLVGTQASDITAADVVFEVQPTGPAAIAFALTRDTGTSASDGVTRNPGVTGTVTSTTAISQVLVSIDGGDFVATPASVDSAGNFAITVPQLRTAAGGTLPDGPLSLQIAVRDSAGAESTSGVLDLTHDSSITSLSNLALAASSDTGTLGDGITSLRGVRIVGEGEPGATISDGTVSTVIAADGSFTLSGVAVAIGDNTISLTTTDQAGNSDTSTLQVTGIAPPAGGTDTPVLTWSQIALESIVDNAAGGTVASRALAMQSVAVYDVIAALDGAQAFMVSTDATAGASLGVAVATASHAVLTYAFPGFAAELDAYLQAALDAETDTASRDAGIALGEAVSAKVIAIRGQDGWDDFEPYAGSDVTGEWRETGPFFNPAENPHFATMDTWTLASQDQFQADGPPDLDSQAYADAVAEVQAIGARDSTTRTADQTEAARFWQDSRGTETTPGHWTSIALDYLETQGLGPAEQARALATLNLAVADAMIAAWDTKYSSGFWRPEDAIRAADTDGNPDTTADPDWVPFLISPSHPEYVSGHGAASGAAAEVLTALFGDQAFTTSSIGLDGVDRSFTSYWEAAEENADSRLWAGVHYDFSNQDGLTLGQEVGAWTLAAFNTTTDGTAPSILLDPDSNFASSIPVSVTGEATDLLSGLAALTVSVNGGLAIDVAFDDDGKFTYDINSTVDGTFLLEFVATDEAGNVSGKVSTERVLDTVAPEVALTSTDSNGDLTGAGSRLTGTIDGTGSPVIALAYTINGGKTTPMAFDATSGAFDTALNLSALGAGDHTVSILAVDSAGNSLQTDVTLTLDAAIPFQVVEFAPENGAGTVGSNFRPKVEFSRPIDITTLTDDSFYATDANGNKLDATIAVGPSGQIAWLFFDEPMPGSSKINVTLEGSKIKAADGTLLDGDEDGNAGGDFASSFSTVSTTGTPNTSIKGYVVDPGNDLKPMTVDDFSVGPDGTTFTDDDVFLSPIEGATIWILGREAIKVTTDADGYFELTDIPAGNIKLAIDGRTATNPPAGVFWPEMVMDVTVIAGQENTLSSSMGTAEERLAREGRTEVYLPRVDSAILSDLSDTAETVVGTTAAAAQDLSDEQRDMIKLVIQPGTALDETGQPVTGGQVGISTVPAELVMDMLPSGIMQHTFDLTIQAPGSAVFTEPAELTLPNVFNAAPGTKLNILSFDHTTGRLVIEGTATVSADGKSVTTDPGTGITKPGWHGMTPPGNPGDLDIGDPDAPDNPRDPNWDPIGVGISRAGVIAGVAAFGFGLAIGPVAAVAAVGFGITSLGLGLFNLYRDSGKTDAVGAAGTIAGVGGGVLDTVGAADEIAKIQFKTVETFGQKTATVFSKAGPALGVVGIGAGAWDLNNRLKQCAGGANFPSSILPPLYDLADGLVTDDLLGLVDWLDTLVARYDDAAAIYNAALLAILGDPIKTLLPNGIPASVVDTHLLVISDAGVITFYDIATSEFLVDPATGEVFQLALADVLALLDFDDPAVQALFEDYGNALIALGNAVEDFGLMSDFGEEFIAISSTAFEGYMDTHGLHSAPTGDVYYLVVNAQTGEEIARGVSDDGLLDVFLPANTWVEVLLFDPDRWAMATHAVFSGPSGSNQIDVFGMGDKDILPVFELDGSELDTDGDLLPDIAERAIGTSITKADTDGDGLSDYLEVIDGLDPLGGFPNSTGIVATLGLTGSVLNVNVVKDPGNLSGNFALVLTSTGLSVVDISQQRNPILIAEATFSDLTPIAASYDAGLGIMAVLGNGGEVRTFDMSDMTDPQEILSIITGAGTVAFVDSYLVVSVGGRLRVFDAVTADEVDSAQLGFATDVTGLTTADGEIYALDNLGKLHVVELINGALIPHGSVATNLSNRDRDMFAADGIVYIPSTTGFQGGYSTVDVSNPDAPVLLSGVDDASIGGTSIALNGAGRGLVVGNPGGAFGVNVIDVVDTSDPTDTGDFLTRYQINATPTAVSIAAGIGLVGDAAGNLHVVNFQSFDSAGVAPVVTINASDIDMDPNTTGVQILEGSMLSLDAVITDDVGLRQVSLLIDGTPITVDLTYPFDLSAAVPILLATETSRNITIQVRAVDTGGNIGLSQTIDAEIVPDTIAPMLISTSLSDGALYGRSVRSFTFNFDEPLDPATATAQFLTLSDANGTVDPTDILLRGRDQSVTLTYDQLTPGTYSFVLSGTGISDVAGNSVGGQDVTYTFDVGTFSNEWIGADGATDWTDIANWTAGRVPDDTDDLYIGVTGNQTLQLPGNAGDITVQTIISEETIVVPSGTRLIIEGEADISKIVLNGGVLELKGPSSIGTLELNSGTVEGDGDVTITEFFDWTAGSVHGAGDFTVENGALAEFGRDIDPDSGYVSQSYLYLDRELTIDGNGLVKGANLYLGSSFYDTVNAVTVYVPGIVRIGASGELDFSSYRSDVTAAYGTQQPPSGVINDGELRKSGGGTSTLVFADSKFGTIVTDDGSISLGYGTYVEVGSTADFGGLTELLLNGGELSVTGDADLAGLTFANGTLSGDGNLTITDKLTWTGGTMAAGGETTIDTGAMLQLGRDFDAETSTYYSNSSVNLYRTLNVDGTAEHDQATVYLGNRVYDNVNNAYVYDPGVISVSQGASYTFDGPAGTTIQRYAADPDSGIDVLGTLLKTGGGTSGIALAGNGAQTGTFSAIDGQFQLTSGTLTLTTALVTAGLTDLAMSGGTLILEDGVTIDQLSVSGGTVSGLGDATITDLDWTGGTIDMAGTLTIPTGGTADFGLLPNQYGSASIQYLSGEISVDGTLNYNSATTYLGSNFYDTAQSAYVQQEGVITVATGGTANFNGYRADISVNYSSATQDSGVKVDGTLIKSGGGASSIPLLAGSAGEFQFLDGRIVFTSGVSTVTAEMVAAGLTDIQLSGGRLIIEDDVTLDSLTITGGVLEAVGDITVADRLDYQGGWIFGTGSVTVDAGATGQLGLPTLESTSARTLYIAGNLVVDGDVDVGNAYVRLGDRDYQAGGDNAYHAGGVSVGSTGTLSFSHESAQVIVNNAAFINDAINPNAPRGIVNAGTIERIDDGTAINLAIAENTGTLDAGSSDGFTLAANAAFDLNSNTSAGTFGALAVNGGSVSITEDVSVADLSFYGGRIDGAGDLTITNQLTWTDGVIAEGGKLIIDTGASGQLGLGFSQIAPATSSQIELMREIEIAGTVELERGTLRLGDYVYDSTTASYTNNPGQITILSGGSFDMVGDSTAILGRFTTASGGTNGNQIVNDGTFDKSGGGISTLQNLVQVDGSGLFIASDGFIEVKSGTTLVLDGAANLSGVRLNGGIIEVVSAQSIDSLEIVSGRLEGAGDLTINTSLVFEQGQMAGTGTTTVAATATALLGRLDDQSANPTSLYPQLGRTLEIAGSAVMEQVNLRLGVNLTTDESGALNILTGGTLELRGPRSDFSDYRDDGVTSNAITNDGTITKTGGGTSTLPAGITFTNNGSVTAPDGLFTSPGLDVGTYTPPATAPVYGTALGNGATQTIVAADGITEYTVSGGVLTIDEDVTFTNLSITSGRIEGSGTITVTGDFHFQRGEIYGDGQLIVQGNGTIGALEDLDSPVNYGSVYLGKEMIVEGTVNHDQVQLDLGRGGFAGVLNIAAGGTYNAIGIEADFARGGSGSATVASEIIVDGTFSKTGGGDSTIANLLMSGSGAVTLSGGTLTLNGGATLDLTTQLDLTGIDNIRLNGGVLNVIDDVSVIGIEMLNGTIQGDGDLTVTGGLQFLRGTITGDGALILADGSDSVFGRGVDPLNPTSTYSEFLGRVTSVEGDLSIARANQLYLGNQVYDATAAAYIKYAGTLDVTSTGSLTLVGEYSDMVVYYNGDTISSGVSIDGAVIKTDGGISNIPILSVGSNAAFTLTDGGLQQVGVDLTLTQAMVDAGLTDLLIGSGRTLTISGDVTIPSLSITSGTVVIDGSLTITDSLDGGGTFKGDGSLILADTATANLTRTTALQLDATLDGTANVSATLDMGSYQYDSTLAAYYYTNGELTVSLGATLNLLDGALLRSSYTPTGGILHGVSLAGTLMIDPLRSSAVDFATEPTGTFVLGEAPLNIAGGTFVLTQTMVDAGLTKLYVSGNARLVVDEDVSIPEVTIYGGTLAGIGDLTVTDSFQMGYTTLEQGGRLIIDSSAVAQFGADFNDDSPFSADYNYVRRVVEVDGAVDHNGSTINLGTQVYNTTTQQYDTFAGVIDIASTGTYSMYGPAANFNVQATTTADPSGVINDGLLQKLEGGDSKLPLIGGTGTFDILSGDLVLSGGTVALTQELIDAGLNSIVVDGGTLTISEALTLVDVDVRSGSLVLTNDVSISGDMTWTGGVIDTGSSTLTIDAGATGIFGTTWDAETRPSGPNLTFTGDMDIAGSVEIESATVRLGNYYYDSNANGYVALPGSMDILAGGTLTMDGPRNSITSAVQYVYGNGADIGVTNDGTLIKTGGGESEIVMSGTQTGVFDQDFGQFVFQSNADRANPSTAFVLTSDMVSNGLTDVIFNFGVLQVDDDVSLDSLALRSGVLDGAGDLTVTDRFDWRAGEIQGTGDLIVAQGAEALIGSTTNPDNGVGETYLELGRDLIIDGSAQLEQARLSLGDTFQFNTIGVVPGTVNVGDTGTLVFYGPKSDVYEVSPGNDDLSGIFSTGTLVKSGSGITTIEDTLEFQNAGAFQLLSGGFDAPGIDSDFGL